MNVIVHNAIAPTEYVKYVSAFKVSKDLERLENFVLDMGSKGYIQMGELIELMDCIYRLEDEEGWIKQ